MKKFSSLFIKSLFVVFAFAGATSCDEKAIELPVYTYEKVVKCERESTKMFMGYHNNRVVDYSLYVNDNLKSKTYVNYNKAGLIYCEIDGITYEIQLSNTKGGSRVESVLAKIDGGVYFFVAYYFDDDNRLIKARIDAEGESVYTNYHYEENAIIVEERAIEYRIELSDLENKGNVCNVLDFAGGPKTSKFVIHPDLYFLRIYGMPIARLPKLPAGQVVYAEDNRLLRVGKYRYDY